MKTKLLILTVLFFGCNLVFSGQNTNAITDTVKQLHIVNYFMKIPESEIGISMKERRKTLNAKIYGEKEEEDVYNYYKIDTIDYKNAYMSFHTTGDGEGNHYELTYYNLEDKTRLIAFNNTYWCMCCESSTFKFYKITYDNEWIDVTDQVLLKITLSDFFPRELITHKIDFETINNPPIVVSLPQKGKNIKLVLDLQSFYDVTRELSDKEFDKIWNKMLCLRFDLIWHEGYFTIGNKSIGDFQRDMYGNIISTP